MKATLKGANQPKRRVLGRGLSALMESTTVTIDVGEQASEARAKLSGVVPKGVVSRSDSQSSLGREELGDEHAGEGQLLYLALDRIHPNKSQPRQYFDEAEIASLADSIRHSGVLQPIIVRRNKNLSSGGFEVVAGERRFRAAQRAGLMKVPALLRQLTDRETLELGIIENVQRSDLNPIEAAQAYQRLVQEFGASQEEIARSVSRDRVSVANALRLLKLPPDVQKFLVSGALSAGHGRALLMLEDPKQQSALARQVAAEQLSVRVTEQLASGKERVGALRKAPKRKASTAKSASVLELEARFRRALGTKVSLSLSKEGAGDLTISFFSRAELDSLLERLNA